MFKNDFLFVFDNVLEESLVDDLNEAIVNSKFANPMRFVKKDELNTHENPAVNTVYQVINKIWFDKLSFLDDNSICGFEPWSNSMRKGGLHLHVDCDEKHYHEHLEVLPPKYTSVFYTGPKNSIVGGELAINLNGITYFTDNKHADIQQQPEKIKKDTKNWITIPYKYNRLIVFDSQAPHCVLDIQSGTEINPRTTFTMTAWDKEIQVLR